VRCDSRASRAAKTNRVGRRPPSLVAMAEHDVWLDIWAATHGAPLVEEESEESDGERRECVEL